MVELLERQKHFGFKKRANLNAMFARTISQEGTEAWDRDSSKLTIQNRLPNLMGQHERILPI
jgi:hypothetical protein